MLLGDDFFIFAISSILECLSKAKLVGLYGADWQQVNWALHECVCT